MQPQMVLCPSHVLLIPYLLCKLSVPGEFELSKQGEWCKEACQKKEGLLVLGARNFVYLGDSNLDFVSLFFSVDFTVASLQKVVGLLLLCWFLQRSCI